jgi:ribosomal protein S15P/S13E
MGVHNKSDKEVRKRKAQNQFAKTAINKIKKLKKHIKRQPNDLQSKKVLEDKL